MASDTAGAGPPRTWRRVAAWVVVVLTAIAVTGSVIGFWVHRTVLDTPAFMASVTPIVESESVQAVVGDRVGDQLVEALSLETRLGERLSQAEDRLLERLAEVLELPDAVTSRLENASLGLESLAPVIAAGVESRIRDAVNTFISSPEGTRLLVQTIEIAHERSVLLLRDELDQLPNVVVDEGEVRLNLVPVIVEVLRSVINAGLDIIGIEREIPAFDSAEDASAAVERLAALLNRDLPPDFGQVRLASEAGLERAQGLVRAFDIALWVLVIVMFVLGGLAIWLAPSVRAGVIRVGVAATLAAIVGWLGVQLISTQVVNAAATSEGREAVGEIVTALVSGLSGTAFALVVIGIGIVAAAIVADRPGRPAVVGAAGAAPPPQPTASEATPERQAPPTSSASAKSTSAKSTSVRKPRAQPSPATPQDSATPQDNATVKDAPTGSAAATKKRRRPPATGA